MIQSFRHKGIKKFFESGNTAGIQPHHAKRLQMILAALNTAQSLEDMHVPGFRLHPLKGSERGRWSVWVNGNYRVTLSSEMDMPTSWTMRTITNDYVQSSASW